MKERPHNLQGYFEIFKGFERTIPDKDRGTESETDMPDVVRPAIEVLFKQNTDKKLEIVEQYGADGVNKISMPNKVREKNERGG